MRPPQKRAVRLHRGTKKPVDPRWPTLTLPDRLYKTRRKNWGCRAGDGLWILDFDLKEGHLDALAAWESEHGRLPGWRVRTGSGGLHVYLRGPDDIKRSSRIPVDGLERGVELKTHRGQYVVWPGALVRGLQYLSEGLKPAPLPRCPDWLVKMTGRAPAPLAMGDGGQSAEERARFGTPADYVWAILGVEPDSNGCISCPAPEHEDANPSCQVRSHNVRCWTHADGAGLTLRASQLVAVSLGLGEFRSGAWRVDSPEDRAAVKARIGELFPERGQ